VRAKGLEWLPAPHLPEGDVPSRVRFEVFVSPFAEPARIYVGSLLEVRRKVRSRDALPTAEGMRSSRVLEVTHHNSPILNAALMTQIAEAFGQAGLPIPAHTAQRRQLVLSVLKDEADDCVRGGPTPDGAKPTAPRPIPLSIPEVIYPAAALDKRVQGTVQIAFTLMEDGGVADIRLLSPPVDQQLEASAIGAASLLLWVPARFGGCAVPSEITYGARYSLR
jgi:TonB family protein